MEVPRGREGERRTIFTAGFTELFNGTRRAASSRSSSHLFLRYLLLLSSSRKKKDYESTLFVLREHIPSLSLPEIRHDSHFPVNDIESLCFSFRSNQFTNSP